MKVICTIDVKSLSPISICGLDPNKFDTFRVSSLRGVISWVLRALVGGAAFDGKKSEVEIARLVQERLMGSTSNSSMINYRIKELKIEESRFPLGYNPQKLAGYIDPKEFRKIEAKIIITSTMISNSNLSMEEELAIGAALLALAFFGIGKRSRRGFGNFIIENIELNGEPSNKLKKVIEGFNRLKILQSETTSVNMSGIAEVVKDIVEGCYQLSKKLIEEIRGLPEREKGRRYPVFPILSREYSKLELLYINKEKVNKRTFQNGYLLTPLDLILALLQRNYYKKVKQRKDNREIKIKTVLGGLSAKLQNVYRNPRKHAKRLGSFYIGIPRGAKAKVKLLKNKTDKSTKKERNGSEKCAKRILEDFRKIYQSEISRIKADVLDFCKEIGLTNRKEIDNAVTWALETIKNSIKIDQEDKSKLSITTGYVFWKTNRRASPLIISPLKIDKKKGIFTVFTFISSDWPKLGLWFRYLKQKNRKRERENKGSKSKLSVFLFSPERREGKRIVDINIITEQGSCTTEVMTKNEVTIDIITDKSGLQGIFKEIEKGLKVVLNDYLSNSERNIIDIWPKSNTT